MRLLFLLLLPTLLSAGPVKVGLDRFFEEGQSVSVKNKKVGLITNHTGVDSTLRTNVDIFKEKANLVAIFTPEHGLTGSAYAAEKVKNGKKGAIPVYSLHGENRRPTAEMLKGIDILIYDIQEIGCRSYTYISTLFYVMEEAAKRKLPLIVLDRPNPMGGKIVDGPMLHDKWRSFLGYANIPYCHGMTVGELARFYNKEYNIQCNLHVVGMLGWKRSMTFQETGLPWIPTSPNIPEPDTPLYYASTGILGALGVVSIGIGYTLPFKVIGAPWIEAESLATKLNAQNLPGVKFHPIHYKPFYGKFQGKQCEGVQIVITDVHKYRPLAVQYMLIGMLKSVYPLQFRTRINQLTENDKASFNKVNGNGEMFEMIKNEPYIAWKLIGYEKDERQDFLDIRKKYLLYD